MWVEKDFDYFFGCLAIFHFHLFLRENIAHDIFKHMEILDEKRPYYLLKTSTNSTATTIAIKTFDDIKSFKDIDVTINYENESRFEFVSFRDFVGIFLFYI